MSAVKIALLSDIHGNLTALNAVLQDVDNLGGADHYLVLGDLAALGPQPVQVLERLNQLPNVQFARGNTDRYVVTGDRPPPTIAQTAKDPSLLPILFDVATTFAWTQGIITQAGWFDWLQKLPFEIRLTLPDGTPLLGVHAAPKADDISIHPNLSNEEIDSHLIDCQADLICMGHTHKPLNVYVSNRHVVNLGSVSNPPGADLRASYVFLTADATTHQLQHRQVTYDYQAVIDTLHRVHHPGRAFIISHFKNRQ
jgi:predicted phosphodiesterase